jgi:hypothetical protein
MLPEDMHPVQKRLIEGFALLDAAGARPILELMFWNRRAERTTLEDGAVEYAHRVPLMRAPKTPKERKRKRWRDADWNDRVDPLDLRWITND